VVILDGLGTGTESTGKDGLEMFSRSDCSKTSGGASGRAQLDTYSRGDISDPVQWKIKRTTLEFFRISHSHVLGRP
jgi:hypothetical protein